MFRFAKRAAMPLLPALIPALGEFEGLAHKGVADETTVADNLFSAHPAAEVVIAKSRW